MGVFLRLYPNLKGATFYQKIVSSGIIVPLEILLPSLIDDLLPRTHSVTLDPSPTKTLSNKIERMIETPAPILQLSPRTKGPISSTFSPITQPFPNKTGPKLRTLPATLHPVPLNNPLDIGVVLKLSGAYPSRISSCNFL